MLKMFPVQFTPEFLKEFREYIKSEKYARKGLRKTEYYLIGGLCILFILNFLFKVPILVYILYMIMSSEVWNNANNNLKAYSKIINQYINTMSIPENNIYQKIMTDCYIAVECYGLREIDFRPSYNEAASELLHRGFKLATQNTSVKLVW